MTVIALGVLAAVFQVVGYAVYGFHVLRKDILPNATSWIMFAYGTTLLVIIELDRSATIALLLLPAACALSSIAVAYYCLRRTGALWWPTHALDRFSFSLDIILTIAYVSTWILLGNDIITGSQKEIAVIFILICWNIGVFTAFFPLLRQVYHHPRSERAIPWMVWTCAYGALTLITFIERQGIDELILYPMVNVLIHGSIAIRVGYNHWRHPQPVI